MARAPLRRARSRWFRPCLRLPAFCEHRREQNESPRLFWTNPHLHSPHTFCTRVTANARTPRPNLNAHGIAGRARILPCSHHHLRTGGVVRSPLDAQTSAGFDFQNSARALCRFSSRLRLMAGHAQSLQIALAVGPTEMQWHHMIDLDCGTDESALLTCCAERMLPKEAAIPTL